MYVSQKKQVGSHYNFYGGLWPEYYSWLIFSLYSYYATKISSMFNTVNYSSKYSKYSPILI